MRHSSKPKGSLDYFNEVEAKKYHVEPHIPQFADFARWSGKSVLEVGCGIGTDAINFARNQAEYVGVELSRQSLNLAERRFRVFGLNGTLVEGDAEQLDKLDLGRKNFDLIYSFGVLHHTPNPGRALSKIRALCHSDTEIRVMLYARNSWKAALIEEELERPEAQDGCPIAYTYTEVEARELFELAGFEVDDIRKDHIFPYQIAPYYRGEYVRQPWFESMPQEMFRALERQLGWHLLIVAHPAKGDGR